MTQEPRSQEFAELGVIELAAEIRAGRMSPSEALEAHLVRIDALNPEINAVITIDEDGARRRARNADAAVVAARRENRVLPPLHGVPMAHKDNAATAGIRTTLGSPLFADAVPTRSALHISRLHAAGVIATGKTNVPEFSAGSHTFNPLFGTTVNPYDTRLSAGGSSGGAAAAVAAGIQPGADGSDTGGSLRTPASFTNLVGYRPSLGRIPEVPTRNPWAWQSRKGFLARTVADVRALTDAVAGPDPQSPAWLPRDDSYAPVVPAPCPDTRPLAGLRIGWTSNFGIGVPVEAAVLATLREAPGVFAALGAEVDEACPDLRDADEVFQTTRAYDFALSLGDLVTAHREQVKGAVVWNVDTGLALTFADLRSAAEARARLFDSVREFFTVHDALIAPAVQVVPFDADWEFPHEVAGVPTPNYLDWMRASSLITATGLPSLSVPGGFTPAGLPVGLQIITADRADALLLRIAEAFETATGHGTRRPQAIAR